MSERSTDDLTALSTSDVLAKRDETALLYAEYALVADSPRLAAAVADRYPELSAEADRRIAAEGI